MNRTPPQLKALTTLIILNLGVTSASLAATTGSISISGVVPASTAIIVTPETGYNSLDLQATATDLKVATITEVNNTTAGYSVTLASSNSGQLKNGSIGSVNYSAKYNGVSVSLSSSPVTVSNVGSQSSAVSTQKDLVVSYTGIPAASLMSGTYSDTLTFVISAN